MTGGAVSIRDLTFAYPGASSRALDGVDLSVDEGEFRALLGPNGAGKTTLIHVLCGVLAPSGGAATVLGRSVERRELGRLTGFCPQDPALYATLTARENLLLFGALSGLRGPDADDAAAKALRTMGLADQAGQRVDRFSGGMKRRLSLAVAMLHGPRLLLLDEPTVGVDAQSRNLIFESLESLHASGTTIIYATHYMEEAERMCRNVSIIDHGRILVTGTTAELTRGGATDRFFVELDGAAVAVSERLADRGLAARQVGPTRLEVAGGDEADLAERVFESARASGAAVRRFEKRRYTLEDYFLERTGRGLRD